MSDSVERTSLIKAMMGRNEGTAVDAVWTYNCNVRAKLRQEKWHHHSYFEIRKQQ
jgi:hypothetical protein